MASKTFDLSISKNTQSRLNSLNLGIAVVVIYMAIGLLWARQPDDFLADLPLAMKVLGIMCLIFFGLFGLLSFLHAYDASPKMTGWAFALFMLCVVATFATYIWARFFI